MSTEDSSGTQTRKKRKTGTNGEMRKIKQPVIQQQRGSTNTNKPNPEPGKSKFTGSGRFHERFKD